MIPKMEDQFERKIPFFNPAEFYLPGYEVPECFQAADEQCIKEQEKKYPGGVVTHPIEVPMPYVDGPEEAWPEMYVTQEWYVKKKKKEAKKKAKEVRILRVEMMQLQAKRDRVRWKLGKLNPHNKRDSKKIVKLNELLEDLNVEIEWLEEESGVPARDLDLGSRVSRALYNAKRKVKKVVKKVRNWYEDHCEIIDTFLGVTIPLLVTKVVGKFQKWLGIA